MLQAFVDYLADLVGLRPRRQTIAISRLPHNFLRV
jgi:hypothetical protein